MGGHLLMARNRCVQIGGGKVVQSILKKSSHSDIFWTMIDNKSN